MAAMTTTTDQYHQVIGRISNKSKEQCATARPGLNKFVNTPHNQQPTTKKHNNQKNQKNDALTLFWVLGKATASPGLVSQPEPRKRGARRLASSTIITFHTFTLSFLKSWNSCRSSTIITFHTFFFSFLERWIPISFRSSTIITFHTFVLIFWKVEFLYHLEAQPLSLFTIVFFVWLWKI